MSLFQDLIKRDADALYDETPSLWQAIAGMLLGLLGYMYFIPQLVAFILVAALHLDVQNLPESDIYFYNTLSQVIGGVICLLIMIFCISFKKVKNIVKNFNFKTIGTGLLYFLVSFLFVGLWSQIATLIWGPVGDNANQQLINTMMKEQPLITIGLTVFLAPLLEELIFRYYMYKGLEKYSPTWAIIITTFAFAFIHMGASLETGTFVEDLKTLPGYLIPSLIFTIAYYKHHKFGVSYVAHLTNNVLATISFYVLQMLPTIANSSSQISSGIELMIKCLI